MSAHPSNPPSNPPAADPRRDESPFWREALLSDPDQGFCILDARSRIILASAIAADILLGAPPESLAGLTLDEAFDGAIAQERADFLERIIGSPARALLVSEVWRGIRCRSVWRVMPPVASRVEILWTVRRAPGLALESEAPRGLDVVEAKHVDWGPLADLAPIQRRVLGLLGAGLAIEQIAGVLGLSIPDAQAHHLAIERALQTTNPALLARRAFLAGL